MKSKNNIEGNFIPKKEKGLFDNFAFFSIIFLALFAIFVILFVQNSPSPSWQWGAEAPPIAKTSEFNLRAGDFLQYDLWIKNASGGKIIIRAIANKNCSGVVLADQILSQRYYSSMQNAYENTNGAYAICIGKDGFERNKFGNKIGSVIGFENASWPYYAPWMLSLKENFSLNANQTLTIIPSNQVQKFPLKIEVLNKTKILGRDAFYVQITSYEISSDYFPSASGNSTIKSIRAYIDDQYRVLLSWESAGTKVELSNASFLPEQ
ncbi:MAG: hypothetical protein WC492_00320 [Candidatus Micrarchaeia archaeon]